MRDGFLGHQSSLMLDVVVVALVAVVPLLLFSLWSVKLRRQFTRHRNLQLLIAALLLLAVLAFEVDMHLIQGGWLQVVSKRTPAPTAEQLAGIRGALRIHLCFAITTPVLWITTIVLALRHFSSPPRPGAHSRTHRVLGWLSAIDLSLTSVTGLWFYYVAFMAPR